MRGHGPWCKPDCFGCKVASLSISATVYATNERKQAVVRQVESDRQTALDLPAYKRLRQQGYQPKSTFGAARLEKLASTEYEIQSGNIHSDSAKVGEAVRMFEDATGQSPLKPLLPKQAV